MLLSHAWSMRNRGLELADSITIDPHKWFYAPLDAGAILVKNERRLTASFGLKPFYLTDELDRANERYQYYVHGFEQSRRFRGLKVWMSFKRYGAHQIGEWIDGNVRQAKHFYSMVIKHSEFGAGKRAAHVRHLHSTSGRIRTKRNPRNSMPRYHGGWSRAEDFGSRPRN